MADQRPTIEWDEIPEPVSPTAPFEGLETKVLRIWLETSPSVRKAHKNPTSSNQVENAVRLAVHAALLEELTLRSQGMTPEDARELTRPAMWTPPTWPTTTAPAVSSAVHERIAAPVDQKLAAVAGGKLSTPAPAAIVAQLDRAWDRAFKANLAKKKAKETATVTGWRPLTITAIEAIWRNQNPALVESLRASNRLAARLAEAKEAASGIMGSAISRGSSPYEARELAEDAIALERSRDDE